MPLPIVATKWCSETSSAAKKAWLTTDGDRQYFMDSPHRCGTVLPARLWVTRRYGIESNYRLALPKASGRRSKYAAADFCDLKIVGSTFIDSTIVRSRQHATQGQKRQCRDSNRSISVSSGPRPLLKRRLAQIRQYQAEAWAECSCSMTAGQCSDVKV